MGLYDFHIHSEWSDGDDSVEKIITIAKQKGLKIIGINDHYSEIKASVPQEPEGLIDYMSEIRETTKEIADDLIVLVGLEFDTFPSNQIDAKILSQFDYLMFEELFPLPKIKKLCAWKEKIQGPEMGISHANFSWPLELFKKITTMLENAGIFLEFNANYTTNFEALKRLKTDVVLNESKVPLSVGSDSHSVQTLGSFDYVEEFLNRICPDYKERLVLYNRFYKK